ncbi:MAG: SagB/ThcOx family dehydrogenase [Tepidisphaeraceae bacterium]|jgi:SagB-type dehydrogenase family enzyme
MPLPDAILDRVRRVAEYHEQSKLPIRDASAAADSGAPRPSAFRFFSDVPRTVLPTQLLSSSTETVSLLRRGMEAVPESQLQPAQNLLTLATWLYLGGGGLPGRGPERPRTYSSEESLFPCEIYAAVFAIDGLEPGLYHFCVRDFALDKLRGGWETLSQIKRGRPELEFLKTTPAVLLFSTIFCRSTWKFALRGYRHAAFDAGRLMQNFSTVGAALGIQTLVRLTANAQSMNGLIGLPGDAAYADAEAVQGMVIWADRAARPMTAPNDKSPARMSPLARNPLAEAVVPYDSIPSIHKDCVAPGVTIREVRPPLTEFSPLPETMATEDFPDPDAVGEFEGGESISRLLLSPTPAGGFSGATISRDRLWNLARCAFRWGTSYPLFPDGPHVALARPLWIIQNVPGVDRGAWGYDPARDVWVCLRTGDFGRDSERLTLSNPGFIGAAAVCFMIANLYRLMAEAGPDLYRLAHLEAGAAAQRLELSARAIELGACATTAFLDDDIRRFFGLDRTFWHPLCAVAIGVPNRAV